MFYFNDFLEKIGIDLQKTRMLRHDIRGLTAWRQGGAAKLGAFASFQSRNSSPYSGAEIACQFVPGPVLPDGDGTALFIGATRILDRWAWNGERLPIMRDQEFIALEKNNPDVEAFDLEWIPAALPFSGRLLVRWGRGARSWSQWPSRQRKEIIEIKIEHLEPPFPGFSRFIAKISNEEGITSQLGALPEAWRGALRSERGVYLLVSDTGEQYVGSAIGQDGFLGRWESYATNGHGGNVLLRQRGYKKYTVSILEVVSASLSPSEIIEREKLWKHKLGSKAYGLNLN